MAKGRVPGGIGDNCPNKHRKALDRNTAARRNATRPAFTGCDVMVDEDFFALPIFGSDTTTVTMGNDASATVMTATTGTTGTAGDYAATTGRFCCLHFAIVVNVRAIVAAATIFVDADVRRPTSWPTIGIAGTKGVTFTAA